MKSDSLFLDTCIFIDCIDYPNCEKIIRRIYNSGYSLTSSISVIGETFTQLMERGPECETIKKFKEQLDRYQVLIRFPNDLVRILCYHIGDELHERDPLFWQVTDRTHLAYALAYQSNFFLTSDNALRSFNLPMKLLEKGFTKPITLTLQHFFDTYIS